MDVETIYRALSRLDMLESDHRLRLKALDALKDMVAKLDELTTHQNLLVTTCEVAMEWAAGYPLGGSFSVMDKWAAEEVYNACAAVLAVVKGDDEYDDCPIETCPGCECATTCALKGD